MTHPLDDLVALTRFEQTTFAYQLSPVTPTIGTVRPGHPFTLMAQDASGNQLRRHTTPEDIDPHRLFPLSGPVRVEGVPAGSTVGIGILDIRCEPTGHVWTRPGLGFEGPDRLAVRSLRIEPPRIVDPSGLELTYQPHTGALGVLPAREVAGRTLGEYGGNLDVPNLGPGSALWVTSAVEGAGIFAGDVHAAIGDAEVCGTGVETPSEIDLVALTANWTVDHPTVMTPVQTWLIGIGESLEAAIADVLPTVIDRLAADRGLLRDQAYLLASLLLDIKICQVVNPLTSVAVSLRQGLDRCLVPAQAHTDFTTFRHRYIEGAHNAHR
ncbi:acetamidase/formamidase family protein [Micromonospora olivasterospora]|uniref:Amidase n=1 Tax=Micromonospora olivasterospora TaxID=1880 RepID=A0A562IKE7_MICOL|nr:acetamidase/formamidase family protein [Micromonospora olivasterospora]TWH71084.1 amidase [Micromonospora olivasterospora]